MPLAFPMTNILPRKLVQNVLLFTGRFSPFALHNDKINIGNILSFFSCLQIYLCRPLSCFIYAVLELENRHYSGKDIIYSYICNLGLTVYRHVKRNYKETELYVKFCGLSLCKIQPNFRGAKRSMSENL